jgi:predicted secreted protein
VIDADDLMLLSAEPLKKDPLYNRLKKKYPAVTLWQGDRSEGAPPLMEKAANGGQRFTVRYRLLNGCHACELLGYVRYIFKFDRTGLFTGTEYVGIETSPDSVGKGESLFSNPSHPIMAGRGKIFTLRLRSNPTTGYIWQLAEPLNDKLIRFIGNEYWGNKTGLVGAGGSEIWTFMALEVGKTEIVMKYVRPWEKEKDPGKGLTFKILIRENE